ncbi:MAG: NADH:ubiquinone reductase (Na(+)-transporting) subunit C [Myxococcales bacterium]|nr:NADH:ubiquinone reductase (Na(+)-transporting) subunit C [Myxococcales bacterium]
MPAEPSAPVGMAPGNLPADSPARAVLVTLIVCAACSAAIASAVTWLRPYQQAHREADRSSRVRELVTAVPGLEHALGPLGTARLEARIIELATGRYVPGNDPDDFDPRVAILDAEESVALPPERDIAGIGRRAHHGVAYEVRDAEGLRLIVLPVYGAGYLSTLYGYLALDADTQTVRGLGFYEHAETPGLGSEIENPQWLARWPGKLARDATGRVRLGVARGAVDPRSSEATHLVDGISGATKTGDGVSGLLRFWLGPDGFGPYLGRLARERGGTP